MKIGDKVRKTKGYKFEGIVVAAFKTTTGLDRFVVEHTDSQTDQSSGMLHIFNGKQLEVVGGDCMQLDLDKIGPCVGSSAHGLTSWSGESFAYWGLFDVDPKSVPLHKLRQHLIKAIDINSEKPNGAIRVHSFVK